MRRTKLFLFIIALIFTAWACDFSSIGLSPADSSDPDPGDVATAVALTLEASGVGAPGDTPPDPPADTPGVTPTDPPPPPPAVLRVAFVDDGDLWLWTEGGIAVELYDDATYDVRDVRLSDDGTVIAFGLSDGYDFSGMRAVNSDGSNLRSLVDTATVNAMGTNPSAIGTQPYSWEFIPGSHVLAFNTHQYYEGPGLDIQNDLRLLNADTAALSTLLAPGSAGEFYYSPDGSQIALVTPTTISLINADGSNRRDSVLTYASIITYSEYQWYAIPRWSLDGSYLRVAIPSPDMLDPAQTVSVWNIPTDGSAATSLGSTAADGTLFNQSSIVSPDMNTLAFLRRIGAPTDNTWDLRFVDLSTYVDTWYHAGQINFEVWGPDSSKFVFKDAGHLFVGQVGAGPIALPDSDRGLNPVWVDAGRVLYLSGGGTNWELRLQTVGSTAVVIVSGVTNTIPFDFSY